MRYKIMPMLKLGTTLINGVLNGLKAFLRILARVKPQSPMTTNQTVTLKFADEGIITIDQLDEKLDSEEVKYAQELIEKALFKDFDIEFSLHEKCAEEPSPAFKILEVEEGKRRIHYETLYPNVAEDRLADFGNIQRTTFEGRQGTDPNGVSKEFIFYKAFLNVFPSFDFNKAVERAVGLEHMDVKDAYENSVRLLEQAEVINKRDYTNDLYSKLEIQGMPQGHALVITTGLRDFPLWIDKDVCRIALNEAASSDGFIRRYYIEINPEVSLNFAASYCYEALRKIAREVVVQGNMWDIWKHDKDL